MLDNSNITQIHWTLSFPSLTCLAGFPSRIRQVTCGVTMSPQDGNPHNGHLNIYNSCRLFVITGYKLDARFYKSGYVRVMLVLVPGKGPELS